MSIVIASVIPNILGLNGSSANAEILAQYLRHAGHDASVVAVSAPEMAPPSVDVLCIGTGSGSSVGPAATALIPLARAMGKWRDAGAWVCAVGTGWDLLGQSVVTSQGDTLPGAGIFASRADHRGERFSGEVYGLDHQDRPSAGYVNQAGHVVLGAGEQPLVTVSSPESHPASDGVAGEKLLATRFGGPALALNPHWAQDIAESVVTEVGGEFHRTDFHDRVEHHAARARELIRARLGVTAG